MVGLEPLTSIHFVNALLIIFSRFPEAGRSKTRLIPALGPEGAANLQACMTGRMTLEARRWAGQHHGRIRIQTHGGSLRHFRNWLGSDLSLAIQRGDTLGERIEKAFQDGFADGFDRVLVVGADCPEIDHHMIQQAFNALEHHDVVLGPAEDGGYVCIGMRRFMAAPFQHIDWGTERVLEQTRGSLISAGIPWTELPPSHDVDRPEDLPFWDRVCPPPTAGSLSVIIPALNEEQTIARAVQSADPSATEVIVVDGGSEDKTVAIAADAGARVIKSAPGRGVQQNNGAAVASAEVLLFLHADAVLPPLYAQRVFEAIEGNTDFSLGAFSLGIDHPGKRYRVVERAVELRSHLAGLPYGDQALFLSRERFVRLGGFPQEGLLEDVSLVDRSRRIGRIHICPEAVSVSARRWERRGIAQTTAINTAILTAYRLGFSATRLAAWYR